MCERYDGDIRRKRCSSIRESAPDDEPSLTAGPIIVALLGGVVQAEAGAAPFANTDGQAQALCAATCRNANGQEIAALGADHAAGRFALRPVLQRTSADPTSKMRRRPLPRHAQSPVVCKRATTWP